MADNGHNKNGTKVSHILKWLLFLGKDSKKGSNNSKLSKEQDDIKNRVLLKIERAEIMAAMIAMGKDKEG